MDIRQCEIFLTLADLLHFGRASRACNLSPSALTRCIQRLEEELGQPLLLRDNRSVELTDIGIKFRDYARKVVRDYNSLRSELKHDDSSIRGSISLYASITAVYSLLPDLVQAYRHAYPGVHLELSTGAAEQAVSQVETGEIDIAVAALPDRQNANLNFLPIMQTPLVLIAAHALAEELGLQKDDPIDWTRVPFVLPQTGLARRRFDQWLKKNRIAAKVSSEVSGNEAIIPMVHLGCGVGVVPQLVLERSPFQNKVVVLRSAPKLESYIVGLCSSRKTLHRPAVQAFWELAGKRSKE